MSWERIPGWSDDIIPFFDAIQHKIPHGGTYVEIGTFLGRSLAYMGTIRPDLQLWAIDPWEDGTSQGYEGPGEFAEYVAARGGLFRAFLSTMMEHAPEVLARTHVVRARTSQVAFDPPTNMIFIDGAHDFDSVCMDIEWARGEPGRHIIAGHDYSPRFPGVVGAVADAFGGKHQLQGSCWWVEL